MGRDEAVERLLSGYRRYYTITRFDGVREEEARGLAEAVHLQKPFFSGGSELSAVCEYYEQGEKYFLFHSAQLWSTAQEEFIFLFKVPRLTLAVFRELSEYAYEAGMDMAHIGPGHMYTYISSLFICDSIDEEARKALEKCHRYKSFRFSFHGWMEFHAGALELTGGHFYFNRAGRCMEKGLRKVFADYPLPQRGMKADA
ncbi:hypothetical protein [uncultured Dialister sp.]|uniref:hypothetical protein n=1 Tax=uncultured Dialister sp. TaxID=278064 RepID=UPI002618FAAA|nr:hypothetical protein [uncultured Dialister sp.]